jgi:hypothetical protein
MLTAPPPLVAEQVFKKYKAWKGFRLWRKAVRQGKSIRVQRILKKNLFLLNPIFQNSLMNIRYASLPYPTLLNHLKRTEAPERDSPSRRLVCEEIRRERVRPTTHPHAPAGY